MPGPWNPMQRLILMSGLLYLGVILCQLEHRALVRRWAELDDQATTYNTEDL